VSAIDDDTVKFPSCAQLTQARQLSRKICISGFPRRFLPCLLDVRETDEFTGELGHIARSVLVPLRHYPNA
jgi:hypothetical protein